MDSHERKRIDWDQPVTQSPALDLAVLLIAAVIVAAIVVVLIGSVFIGGSEGLEQDLRAPEKLHPVRGG